MYKKHVKNGIQAGQRLWGLLLVLGLTACGSGNDTLTGQPPVPTQSVPINVLSVLVTPMYTLNGGAFSFSEYDDGNLVLRDTPERTDTAMLGSSHDVNPLAVRVMQGNYDVLFQHETGDGVPQNVDTPVLTNVDLTSDQNPFAIAVTEVTVRPSFTLDSGAFPVTEYDDGVFYLQPNAGGERIFLGNSHTAMPDNVQVMPGFYDVIYASESSGIQAPYNQSAVIMTAVDLTSDAALPVNVDSVVFRFDATLDTSAFSQTQYQHAIFLLRNITTGDIVELGASYELPVSVPVVAGTYDIIYRYVQGDTLPVNTDAIVVGGVVVSDGIPAQSIDISSAEITPSFTLNGVAFPAEVYESARFYLRGRTNPNDEMLLGASYFATPDPVRVISSTVVGNYDAVYRVNIGSTVPQNTNAMLPGTSDLALNADQALVVPVTSIDVTGVFTLNGNSFPDNASDSVQFLLRDTSNDSDEFLFGFSDIANEPVKIIPSTYDVVMDHLDGDAVPQNKMHEVDFGNVLNTDQTLNVNVQAIRVNPSFTLDGVSFPASFYQRAEFYLRETLSHGAGKLIFLGHSYKNNEPVMVIKEDYNAIYKHIGGEQVPQNSNGNVGLVDL